MSRPKKKDKREVRVAVMLNQDEFLKLCDIKRIMEAERDLEYPMSYAAAFRESMLRDYDETHKRIFA